MQLPQTASVNCQRHVRPDTMGYAVNLNIDCQFAYRRYRRNWQDRHQNYGVQFEQMLCLYHHVKIVTNP